MRKFRIDNINKTVIFTFDFDQDIINSIKLCGYKVRWNPEFKHWVVPVDDYTKHKIIAIIGDYAFTKQGEKAQTEVSFSYKVSDSRLKELTLMCDKLDFSYTPRQYQLEALEYALVKGNIINGDDVGLGKTFESIMYAEVTNSFPCLVIVPASVKEQWKTVWLEITKNKRSVSVINSNIKKNDWNSDVVIINYDIIGKKQGTGATVKFRELVDTKWLMTILDEAHFLKEKNSNRAKAAKMILKRDMIIQMLSGTVTMNKPVELWNLLVLAKVEKKIVRDWMQFITRYCGGYRGKFGWVTDGATNIFELNGRLREVCYIRREKSDVLKELPNVIKQIIKVPITNIKEIKRATDDFIDYIEETKGIEAADKAMEAEHLVALGVMRRLSIEGKLKAIEGYIKDWKQGDAKLLIFGIHRAPLDYLADKFKSPFLSRAKNAKHKQQMVADWVKSDEQFMFANITSAGTGVDGLQYVCSNMLVIELPWRPSDLEQLIGRLHRSGQKSVSNVTFMLSSQTIDEQMLEMLDEKERVTEAVNKGIDVTKNGSGIKSVMRKILKLNKKNNGTHN